MVPLRIGFVIIRMYRENIHILIAVLALGAIFIGITIILTLVSSGALTL